MKKKIWIVTQTNGYGGTELHTIELMRKLVDAGYFIYLVCCNHSVYDQKINQSSVKILHIDCNINSFNIHDLQALISLFSSNAKLCEKLIFPKGHYSMGSCLFLKTCKKYFKKIYFIEHSEADKMPEKTSKKYLNGLFSGIGLWWYKIKYKRYKPSIYADKIIAVSNAVANALINECWYPRKKIRVVQNSTYVTNYVRDKNIGTCFKRKHNIPEDHVVFGMVTRLDPVKGIDIAIQSFKLLIDNHGYLNTNLIICGTGEEKDNLIKLADASGVSESIRFLGFIENTRDAYCAIDAILFPSRREGLPLSLLESMANGCFPIVTNISGMPEVVSDQSLGYLVSTDPAEICEAMIYYLTQEKHIIENMRFAVANHIKDNFNAEKNIPKIIKMIEY
jgi:glycosyltransferase involved in cell wall biosynthesis